ncbi:NADP-dependent 3-hydroxy acid dehydrogenase YdfG [Deinobacterium chartae]|uniref:NADP-dependent 3-hydroxy acid dehydrogenase YdfG n=1 Tax=Deinobacterium chartae TaxID=521158 RepID=A0A841HTT9_9DEIO|nr:SDR family oxidoreductase [Deinobacterium chartae]MBB6096841.1 NADP-dependent 3-hydroxy acid dehydrogenase YdfG [Deinobacterium chartae]
MDLSHHTVAVTGASRGIGQAVVRALLERGARVVAGARDVSALEALPHPNLTAVSLDVTDPAAARAFGARAAELGASALINNAGVGVFKPTEEITLEDYRRVMDTNVLGTLLVTQALLPHFQARRDASVINVTSDVSDRTFAGGALYTASKFAQRALTRALAYEGQAYGLRVTEIRPGMVDTYFADTQQGEAHKHGWLRAEDIAQAVVYVLSQPPHLRVDELLLHPVQQEVTF